MKKSWNKTAFVLPAIILTTILSSGAEQNQHPVNLIVNLVDGSRISGTTTAGSLPFRTDYAKMDLGIELIRTIDFAGGEKKAGVHLNNGDALQGAFEFTAINIETLLGMQSIPLALISTITIHAQDIRRGLVLHYSLDDKTDNAVVDKSGHGNNGVAHGEIEGTSTGIAYRHFDGQGTFIECKDSPSLNMRGGMSILAWVKPLSWGNGESNGVVSKKENDYSNGYVLYNDGYYPKELNLRIKGTVGSAGMLHSRSTVDVGRMQHWAVTYDADEKQVRFYKNSALDTTYTSVGVGDMSNELPLHVGHAQTWGGYFRGHLGNVMVYDRALSSEEVKQVYDSQKLPGH